MDAFCKCNPGSTMQLREDPITHVFESLVFIPAQSYLIMQYAGRTWVSLDAGHTCCKGWRCKIYILVGSDGEHKNIPLAMGIYKEETIEGYSDFLRAVKGHMSGVFVGGLAPLLNQYSTVICTDRCLSFCPAITAELPLAHHRYDVRHIQQNIKDKPLLNRGPSSNIWACHRATSKDEFDLHMVDWMKVNEPGATYANGILHEFWCTYPAVEAAIPYYTFSFTGSQAVEQEMARFLKLKIRHQLPLKAIKNYVKLFSRIIDERLVQVNKLRMNTAKRLTDYATLKVGEALGSSYQFKARELVGPRLYGPHKTYEVEFASYEGGPCRTVVWPISLAEVKTCTCHEPRLEGLPCRHLLCVYKLRYTRQEQSPEHLLRMFGMNIASFYYKDNYMHGYIASVMKPNVTYLVRGTTKAPKPEKKKGPEQVARHLSASEGNFGSSKNSRAIPRTEANIELYDLQAQLDRDLLGGGRISFENTSIC
jgi:hypothetical protein